MNKQVVYREFIESDVKDLLEVIIDSWQYEEFLTGDNIQHYAKLFLFAELARQNFSIVAEVEGKAMGIILGDVKGDTTIPGKKYGAKMIKAGAQLLLSKEGRQAFRNLMQGEMRLDQKMINRQEETFDAEVALFAVSPETQGLGVGKELFNRFEAECRNRNLANYFLYTDTTCNYGFYDYRGLERIDSTRHYVKAPTNKMMEYYLYKGTLN